MTAIKLNSSSSVFDGAYSATQIAQVSDYHIWLINWYRGEGPLIIPQWRPIQQARKKSSKLRHGCTNNYCWNFDITWLCLLIVLWFWQNASGVIIESDFWTLGLSHIKASDKHGLAALMMSEIQTKLGNIETAVVMRGDECSQTQLWPLTQTPLQYYKSFQILGCTHHVSIFFKILTVFTFSEQTQILRYVFHIRFDILNGAYRNPSNKSLVFLTCTPFNIFNLYLISKIVTIVTGVIVILTKCNYHYPHQNISSIGSLPRPSSEVPDSLGSGWSPCGMPRAH